MTPGATYRLQLHAGFGFDAAAGVVPYLARLGITHLYLSPILQAAPGSTHGYDVVDHARIDEERGGRGAFDHLAATAADHGISIVVDIVPNHMALAGAANRWWWDVLAQGPASLHAAAFDIDWEWGASPEPSVLMPILGDHRGRVVEAGDLHLDRREGGFVVRYAEHELPLAPDTTTGIATDADLLAIERDPDALDDLLGRQHYRLAHWQVASDELDYRRFFDITSLVGLRVEDEPVFTASHELLLELVADGVVTGLRVDHVDGLRDPARYLERLRAAAPGAWLVVEKILAADEELDPAWPVDGTTGYEFARVVGDVFVAADGAASLVAHHAAFTGAPEDFDEVVVASKRRVLGRELAAEVERVTDLLADLCRSRRRHCDHTRRDLRRAVTELVTSFDVYRTYVVPGKPVRVEDRRRVGHAVTAAAERCPDIDGELLGLLGRALVLEEAGGEELAARFQQLSAPAMAKGLEDTAFYRWLPVPSANEVGGEPGQAGQGAGPLHAHNRVATTWPRTMRCLSTHDTKRSADVRARLAVLTEVSDAWTDAVDRWRVANEVHRDGWDDPTMELFLYQSLVGAWPIGADRLEPVLHKAANEAKVHTSWRDPDHTYVERLAGFVEAVLTDESFLRDVERFLTDHDLVARGRLLSLAQVALLHTSPGVPDTYQGDELWDLSLVDPDNRRPVDFARREALLAAAESATAEEVLDRWEEGLPKLWLIRRLLHHRRSAPERYAATAYEPLTVRGTRAAHVVAFARSGLAVAVPARSDLGAASWQGTAVELPPGEWCDVLTGDGRTGAIEVGALWGRFPVAVLDRRAP